MTTQPIILKTRSTHAYALVRYRRGEFGIIGYADYPRSPANVRRASACGGEFLPVLPIPHARTTRQVIVPTSMVDKYQP